MGGKKGAGMVLGSSALIGQRVRDVSGKFRVVMGPLGLERFRALLPNGVQSGLMDYLVRLYATDYLDYDIELLLKTSEVPPMTLGGTQMLGIDAWVGRPAGEVISVVVQYP
jgi:type VI secretion system protein ImpH